MYILCSPLQNWVGVRMPEVYEKNFWRGQPRKKQEPAKITFKSGTSFSWLWDSDNFVRPAKDTTVIFLTLLCDKTAK